MIRITGGELKGRILKTPRGEQTRPTQARLRQALFNSLQTVISGARVLDLFAGSGALGFESLSRGAQSVVFVEQARSAVHLIQSNARDLRLLGRIEIIEGALNRSIKTLSKRGPFHLVLADPPYAGGWELKLLETLPWAELLAPEGLFCLEWGVQKSRVDHLPDQVFLDSSGASPAQLVKIREKTYGDSILSTYCKQSGSSMSVI